MQREMKIFEHGTSQPIARMAEHEQSSLKAFWRKDSETNARACQPADEAIATSEEFKSNIKKRLTKKQSLYLEEQADLDTLRILMQQSLDHASTQIEKYSQNSSLTARFGRKAADITYTINGFIDAYAGIVEVMKQSTGQYDYGNVAYQTMTLFLVIAANKNRREENIDNMLRTLQSEFSRMKALQEIHATEKMKTYIAQAYRLGILFLREAIIYYSGSSFKRIWENIVNPPQVLLDKNVAQITRNMAEIDKERSFLDSVRLAEVQKAVQKVESKVEEIHQQNELKLLASLKTKIFAGSQDIHETFERYHSRLKDTFGEDRDFNFFTKVSIRSIRKKQVYQEWSTNQKSCILLLQGETAGYTHFNWLSPAAIGLAKEPHNGTTAVAFHCCQPADSTDSGDNPAAILSSIIYQLLEAQPVILRNQAQYENLVQTLNSSRRHLNALDALFKSITSVFLVLDRVERLNGDVEDFLESLLTRICVAKTSCEVKVLLTSSSNSRLTDAMVSSLKGTMGGSEYFKVLELNQEDVDWDYA